MCSTYGDCCSDYNQVCGTGASCVGRCGPGHESNFPCQCNTMCSTYGDCCADYTQVCGTGGGDNACSDDALSCLMQDLWENDVNRMPDGGYVLNTASSPLFASVDEDYFSTRSTYKNFTALLDNYIASSGTAEQVTTAEVQEQDDFLDAILATSVVDKAYVYLSTNGYITNSPSDFRDTLKELWFNLYARSSSSGILDSSGFEHVVVGELKTSSSVSGFHSWIQFYLEEKAGRLLHHNTVSVKEPNMIASEFTWNGARKSKGSFFHGSSPEFDIAVYTTCAIAHVNSQCQFTLKDGQNISIQTWDIGHKAGRQIASAYPVF